MAKEKFRIPDLSNASLPFCIDELGQTRKDMKQMEKYEGILKQRIQSMRDKTKDEVEGSKFRLKFSFDTRTSLDQEKVKADFPTEEAYSEWFKAHSKSTSFDKINSYELENPKED